jgi:poly(A) polymerase
VCASTVSSTRRHEPFQAPDPEIEAILDFVRQRAGEAWLVGGYVRDRLLDRPTHDIDLVVRTGAIPLARAVADHFAGHFYVLDLQRDVARAIVPAGGGCSLNVDVARLRAADIAADLSLRDFTINAMGSPLLEQPATASLIDPLGGEDDLRHSVIRAAGDQVFFEDPLRLLRAVRQAGELEFRVDAKTFSLIRRDASLVASVSAERVRDELVRLLSLPASWRPLTMLLEAGLLRQVLPEAASLAGVSQSAPHGQDVFDHTLGVLAQLDEIQGLIYAPGPADRQAVEKRRGGPPVMDGDDWARLAAIIRPYHADLRAHLDGQVAVGRSRLDCLAWAVLAHDWGKPSTRRVEESGRIRFLGHEERGAALARARLAALRFSSNETDRIARLVALHMRPGYLAHDYPPGRRAVYRYFRDAADSGPECVLLSLADHAAIRAGNRLVESWERHLNTAGLLLEVYFREHAERVDPRPFVDGHELMAICGLDQGPAVGALLEDLREAQAAGEVTDRDEALRWLARRTEERGD